MKHWLIMDRQQNVIEEVEFETYADVEKYLIGTFDIREADSEGCEI